MKKFLSLVLCAALMLTGLAASAAPVINANGYTAYLGNEAHLYLLDPQGVLKVLKLPMADVLSISPTHVYAASQGGMLISITLDGAHTAILMEEPADSALPAPFELADGTLSLVKTDGSKLLAASDVLHAADNGEQLFFLQMQEGLPHLMSLPLAGVDLLPVAPTAADLQVTAIAPLSLTASADAVSIVNGDHSVMVVSLVGSIDPATNLPRTQQGLAMHPAISDATAMAFSTGGKLYRYAAAPNGTWLVETDPAAAIPMAEAPTPTPTQPVIATSVPTRTPVIATTKPTATPRIDLDDEDPYPQLKYGDTGSSVRKMQRRLKDLGYPVGHVDGDWGENTQLAVNLFQNAIGYKERSYATSKMQERLYSSKAPKYDKYKPLKEGNSGTPVRLMQQALFDLGYFGEHEEEVDGHYGPKTAAAVMAFQVEIINSPEDFSDEIQPTGKADRETLKVLFGTMAPMAPTAPIPPTDPNYPELITPAPAVTEPPAALITPEPSQEPSAEPTEPLYIFVTPKPAS